MHEEGLSLKKLGEEAVRLREARGLSQKDVAEALHIRERFVDAIEKGDEGCFPAPIYARGFIRNYLEFLGAGQLWKAFAEEVPLEQPSDPSQPKPCSQSISRASGQHPEACVSEVRVERERVLDTAPPHRRE